jgi:GNAT superfamily N-acetyltransferase
MVSPGILLKASLQASREFFRPPISEHPTPGPATREAAPVMVPIRSIGPSHGERIATHLLALDAQDRYLRFGYAASDEQIRRYVNGLNFERDEIFGIYNRKLELIAMAHLAFSTNPALQSCAEFGVSVLKQGRGRGYGSRLFDRAVIHARN